VWRARRGNEYEEHARACASNGAAERYGVYVEFRDQRMYGIRELAVSRYSLMRELSQFDQVKIIRSSLSL
jgi:hypothetical protein